MKRTELQVSLRPLSCCLRGRVARAVEVVKSDALVIRRKARRPQGEAQHVIETFPVSETLSPL